MHRRSHARTLRHASLTASLTLALVGVAPDALAAPKEQTRPELPSVYTREGTLGAVRLVPTVAASVPDGLRFALSAKWRGLLSFGASFGFLPDTAIPTTTAHLGRTTADVRARLHPFQRAFFVGVAAGGAWTHGGATKSVTRYGETFPATTTGDVTALTLTPHLGFQWMVAMTRTTALTLGFDVGVAVPVVTDGPSFVVSARGRDATVDTSGGLGDSLRGLAKMPLPVVSVLEIGYAL